MEDTAPIKIFLNLMDHSWDLAIRYEYQKKIPGRYIVRVFF